MPTCYRIDPQLRLVCSIFRDLLTDLDLRKHIEKLSGDCNFDPRFAELIDCSAVTDFQVSSDLIGKLAEQELGSASSRWAIVAPQIHIFGMARMFQIRRNSEMVEVFHELDSAQEWVGITQEKPSGAERHRSFFDDRILPQESNS